MTSLLTRRYSKAFYELCVQQNKSEAVHKDLIKIKQLIDDSADFTGFLRNPSLAFAPACAILEEIFKGRIAPETLNFILFLKAKNRLSILGEVCDFFHELYSLDKGVAKVKITSSIALTKHQTDLLREYLSKKLGQEITSDVAVDEKLIGGFKIKVKDTIYDSSIKTQLEKFEEALLTA